MTKIYAFLSNKWVQFAMELGMVIFAFLLCLAMALL